MSGNAQSLEDYDRQRAKEHDRALRESAHSQQLANALDVDQAEVEYLREILRTQLDWPSIAIIDNFVSPDFVLSNVQQKDMDVFRWQLESIKLRVFAMHPPQNGVAGEARAYYYNDKDDKLEPLRPQQREAIRAYFKGILWRARRSKEGYQQDKVGETTSRVETVDGQSKGDDSGGRVRGLLSR